jgi:hypothetical protein
VAGLYAIINGLNLNDLGVQTKIKDKANEARLVIILADKEGDKDKVAYCAATARVLKNFQNISGKLSK